MSYKAWHHVAITMQGSDVKADRTARIYLDGVKVAEKTDLIRNNANSTDYLAFGNSINGSSNSYDGQIDEVRVMPVSSSEDWMKAEYETVAKDGFLVYGAAAMQTARGLTVTAAPEEIGTVSPAYGKYKNLAAGSETVCTAPAEEFDITAQKHARFVGWKYYVVDEDGYYQLADEGDTLTYTYTQVEDMAAKLEWQVAYRWTADVAISIPAGDAGKGTVAGGGTYQVGEQVTLTAKPAAGETFYYWEGDLPAGVSPSSPTLTFTLGEQGANFVAHFTGKTARWTEPVSGNYTDATKWEGGVVPDNDGTVDIVFPSTDTLYSVTFPNGTTKVRSITHECSATTTSKTRKGPNWAYDVFTVANLELGAGGFTALSDKTMPWSNDSRVNIKLVASQTWRFSSDAVNNNFNSDRFVHYAGMSINEGVEWNIMSNAGYDFNGATKQKDVHGRIRTNSNVAGTAGFGNAMEGFEWFNYTDAETGSVVPGAAGKEETAITTKGAADGDFNAEMNVDFAEGGAKATFTHVVDLTTLKVYNLTNKWTGASDIGTKFALKFGQTYGLRYPGKQGVRFGNDASTLTFGGTTPGIDFDAALVELVSNNALGLGNGTPISITGGHGLGYYRGVLLRDGVTVQGKVKVDGGLYTHNLLGTTEAGATVGYAGEIAAIGDAYPFTFVAAEGATATFDGKVTAKGRDDYNRTCYAHIVSGDGAVVFNGNDSGVDCRFRVRGGTMGLGHEYAGGKNKEILLGGTVPMLVSARCVRYLDGANGTTVDDKYVVSGTAGQPFVFDGVTLAVGDKVLVVGGVDPQNSAQNGVFEVTAIDKMTRISDSWLAGTRVEVEEGDNFAGCSWRKVNDASTLFMYEPCTKHDPDVAVKTAGAVTIANPITVTDNKSAGRSAIGGLTADESAFTGTITLAKDVTFEAVPGGTVTIAGPLVDADGTGTHKVYVTGTGKVVFGAGTVAGRTVDFTGLTEEALNADGRSRFVVASGLEGATVVLPDDGTMKNWAVVLENGSVRISRKGILFFVK